MKRYRDHSPYTEEFYLKNLRKMSGEKRLTISFELRDLAIAICKEGIKSQNPAIDDKGVEEELLRRLGYDTTVSIRKSDG